MEIFYHGSSVLFVRFDLSHVLEGDGKVKFGYGVYLTSSFKSAAHYSGANKSATTNFVLLVSAKTFKPYLAFYFPRTADTNTETGGLSMHKITQNSRVNTFTGHQ